MNNQTEPEPNLATVDLDQWRRDIAIFAAATSSALDAIVDELSNSCSSDGVSTVSSSRGIPAIPFRSPIVPPQKNESVVQGTPAEPASASYNGSSRLALIKEKLASRMKKG